MLFCLYQEALGGLGIAKLDRHGRLRQANSAAQERVIRAEAVLMELSELPGQPGIVAAHLAGYGHEKETASHDQGVVGAHRASRFPECLVPARQMAAHHILECPYPRDIPFLQAVFTESDAAAAAVNLRVETQRVLIV